jgi:hypothetical protein
MLYALRSGEDFREHMKFRLLLGAIAVLVISGFACVSELRYLCFGKSTVAELVGLGEETTRGRYGSTSVHTVVKYRFTDPAMAGVEIEDRWGKLVQASTVRTESDRVSDDWVPPASGTLDVQYLAGSAESSRLAGHTRAWLCAPMLVSLVAVAVLGVQFTREYREHERRKSNA